MGSIVRNQDYAPAEPTEQERTVVSRSTRALVPVLTVLLAALTLGACSDDDDGDAASDTTASTAAPSDETGTDTTGEVASGTCTTDDTGPLLIVLVNDDGVENPAIDVLIEHFADQSEIALDVTPIAPADERSGSSDATTPGGVEYSESTTPGGHDAYAVEGFPADAVLVALDDLGLEPHLVVSGINPGHNFGTFAPLSGTVGVGRTAIRRGVPALAVSAGPDLDEAQFGIGADLAIDWIAEHCEALLAGGFQTDTLASINIPACAPDQMGPLQEVPRALEMPELSEDDDIFASTCDLADPAPANDVAAVRSGYPSLTQVEPEI